MAFTCRHTTPADQDRLIGFLTRVFSSDTDNDFATPSLLQWKYWEPREDYPQARSFVLEKDGRIVAHAGFWPVKVSTGTKNENGIHLIDWAADPEVPGAGVYLLQRLSETCDFLYAIGGTEITVSILRTLGFRQIAEALVWARPIRPWRQILNHQSVDLRLPLRLVRNFWWSKTPSPTVEDGWSAVQLSEGHLKGLGFFAKERDDSFFRYIERCPVARCLTFNVFEKDRRVGFFVMSAKWEQTRIAGVWLEDTSPRVWRAVFRLAQEAALRLTSTSEIVARGTTEACATAAAQAGMRLRARVPVMLHRKAGAAGPLPLQFHFLDNDEFFLGSRLSGFAT
jgi:Acetyltransferase (GNAT) domain